MEEKPSASVLVRKFVVDRTAWAGLITMVRQAHHEREGATRPLTLSLLKGQRFSTNLRDRTLVSDQRERADGRALKRNSVLFECDHLKVLATALYVCHGALKDLVRVAGAVAHACDPERS